MNAGPSIVKIGTLIGDHARAAMLTALMSGKVMTATELSNEAGITRQTASSHLSRLVDGHLLIVIQQGRHRYFSIASEQVGQMLESLMGVAQNSVITKFHPGPRDPALRQARVCYNHLAGDFGVAIYDSFLNQKFLSLSATNEQSLATLKLTDVGRDFCQGQGIDLDQSHTRSAICKPCLDWSERRYHLAGRLGTQLLKHCYENNWASRVEGSRAIKFSNRGLSEFKQFFQLQV